MSIWDWLTDYYWTARDEGDEEKQRLAELAFDAFDGEFQEDPDGKLSLFARGSELARQMNEPWWEGFYDHWQLQILLHYKRDFKAAQEMAVRSVLKARKPACAGLPQRVCLHEDLIACYVGIDPHGHEQKIEDALNYMAGEAQPGTDCAHCLLSWRAEFAEALERWDEAEEWGLRALALAQSRGDGNGRHYEASAYTHLCFLAQEKGDWEQMLEWARAGEEAALDRDRDDKVAEAQLWQAVALKNLGGSDEEAARLHRVAVAKMTRLPMTPGPGYFNALAFYQEACGNLEGAVATCDEELRFIEGSGRSFREANVHLSRCRLLAEMGTLTNADVSAAREAAAHLRHPQKYHDELARLFPEAAGEA